MGSSAYCSSDTVTQISTYSIYCVQCAFEKLTICKSVKKSGWHYFVHYLLTFLPFNCCHMHMFYPAEKYTAGVFVHHALITTWFLTQAFKNIVHYWMKNSIV